MSRGSGVESTTGAVAVGLRGFTVAGSFRRCRCRSSHPSPYFSKGQVHRDSGSEKIELTERFISGPGGVPMQTECSADLFGFAPVEGRKVVAAFDGGTMTSEAGALLLGATDRQVGLIERFAGCFTDHRLAELVVHEVAGLVGQRVFGIALGYEDLIDHDQLRHDPVMAV